MYEIKSYQERDELLKRYPAESHVVRNVVNRMPQLIRASL